MSAEYTRDHCKIAVAKILQTIGWHSINSTPLEVLTDILSNYIKELAKTSNDYANEFGQTEPNLDHLGLAFEEMGVNLPELEEYVTYVNFVPPAHPVPKYPLPKESNLNFLKPGSKEVVTRPVHINEHLPPMYPLLEEQNEPVTENCLDKKENTDNNEFDQFKKPAEVGSQEFKRIKREEESGRPTREISSVMMTTSGFLSPAREGRLPETKAPAPPPEPPKPPSPIPAPELVPVIKKKPEKKREKIGKELFKPDPPQEKVSKKASNMKDVLSIKRAKAMAANAANMMSPVMSGIQPLPTHFMSQAFAGDMKMPPLVPHKPHPAKSSNFNKALAAAKAKTEKLNTTITPIHVKAEPKSHPVDKLVTEPDKKKINILRKISNVKHEKPKSNPAHQLMQQTQDIVSKISLSSDITIEPINPMSMYHSHMKMESTSYFDHGSPPGTPPTPRTPEILAQCPPFKEKRKRKEKPEKPRVKKPRKQIPMPQPHFLDSDFLDMSMGMGRPKTPEAHLVMRKTPQFPAMPSNPGLPFVPFFPGPGLIPTMANSMLFAPPMPEFSKNPYAFPMMAPKQEPVQKVSPKPKQPKEEPKEIKSELLEVPTHIPTPATKLSPIPKPPPVVPVIQEAPIKIDDDEVSSVDVKKLKEHKKDKKDKLKKKNKKEKIKDKTEKKKLKEAKKEKLKIKKEKKEKKKMPKEEIVPETPAAIPKILLKVNSPSPRPETPEAMKKLNIKPIVKKEDHSPERKPQPDPQRESSPGLAQISALVIGPPKPKLASPVAAPSPGPEKAEKPAESSPTTPSRPPGRPRIHPAKPKPLPKPKKIEQPPFVKVDAEGNEVWICPACGQQDDGRPMIGCDGCDAWYHWVCVGIQVPPDENENWYCKPCLAKKNEDLQDRKKKRKKKDKGH